MIKGVYGFNIAVKDLPAAVKVFEDLFGVKSEPLEPSDFAFPGLEGVKLIVEPGIAINLVSSNDPQSVVGKFLEKKGEGFLLLSLEVDNIETDVKNVRELGLATIMDQSASGEYGKVNFIHPKSCHGVQVELLQPSARWRIE